MIASFSICVIHTGFEGSLETSMLEDGHEEPEDSAGTKKASEESEEAPSLHTCVPSEISPASNVSEGWRFVINFSSHI